MSSIRWLLVFPALLAGCGILPDGTTTSSATSTSTTVPMVDLLFVMDTSDSMSGSAASVGFAAEDLATALDDANANWTLSVTTTGVDYAGGPTSGIDPGEVGTLVLTGERDAEAFRTAVLCEATCFDANDHNRC